MLPSKSEIIDAMVDSNNIMDKSIAGGQLVMNGIVPLVYQGGFGMVFKINHNGKDHAVKVWTIKIDDIKERLQKVSASLTSLQLPYFVSYNFSEGCLRVPADSSVDDNATDQYLDALLMDWADGVLLKNYLDETINNSSPKETHEQLMKLASNLKKCFCDLHKNHISHGDLQHGNILIYEVNGDPQIKLIDYDSLYVPSLQGYYQTTSGLGAFQHPGRIIAGANTMCSEKDDYFSEKILYLTILLLASDPKLWKDANVNVEENDWGILFKQEDFDNFENSYLFNYIKQNNALFDVEIVNLLDEIANDLKKKFTDVEAIKGTVENPYERKVSSSLDIDPADIAILKGRSVSSQVKPARKIDIPDVDRSKYARKDS